MVQCWSALSRKTRYETIWIPGLFWEQVVEMDWRMDVSFKPHRDFLTVDDWLHRARASLCPPQILPAAALLKLQTSEQLTLSNTFSKQSGLNSPWFWDTWGREAFLTDFQVLKASKGIRRERVSIYLLPPEMFFSVIHSSAPAFPWLFTIQHTLAWLPVDLSSEMLSGNLFDKQMRWFFLLL